MTTPTFAGTLAALVTPFRAAQVDVRPLPALLEAQIAGGSCRKGALPFAATIAAVKASPILAFAAALFVGCGGAESAQPPQPQHETRSRPDRHLAESDEGAAPFEPAAADPHIEFAFVASDASRPSWRALVLQYEALSGRQSVSTGLGGEHCVHDAWRECTHDPVHIPLRASCVSEGVGAEAKISVDDVGACSLEARDIDQSHASRGIVPEWSRIASVPCPPRGSPCPDFVR